MTDGTVHIVGAGLAGLSTALRLTHAGAHVVMHEAAGHAGGRCRTLWDRRLGRHIDNGNHLVLTGNTSVRAYLGLAGARGALRPSRKAEFSFVDLASGSRWTVRPNRGPFPWWTAMPGRRVPGTVIADYLAGWRLALADNRTTVAQAIHDRGPLWRGFWEPLTLAALNTTPEAGAAPLLWRVLRETFLRGATYSRPMFAPTGLGPALVEPALSTLREEGVEIRFNRALKAMERDERRATGLIFGDGADIALGASDRVVLALPPTRLKAVMPEFDLPDDTSAILNAHFVIDSPEALAEVPPLLGVLGARTHWIFTRGDVVSLTVSAADRLGMLDRDREVLLEELWGETRLALALTGRSYIAGRIITEKRATFDQSPTGVAKRPPAKTSMENLFLAGDATDTGLPATIEGAIRSGETAAKLAKR